MVSVTGKPTQLFKVGTYVIIPVWAVKVILAGAVCAGGAPVPVGETPMFTLLVADQVSVTPAAGTVIIATWGI
jgi:hypothetical protein